MTGTGTQADPYLVDNIADFRSACVKSDAYIKLIADLDCNSEGYLSWTELQSDCKEVDFNGYALINPLVATNSRLINGRSKLLLKNGQILNIYENGAYNILYDCGLANMTISAYLTKTIQTSFSGVVAEKCNFVIENKNLNNKEWFSTAQNTVLNMTGFKDCRFELNGNIAQESLIDSWNANLSNLVADGCRFEGKLNINYPTVTAAYLIYGRIINSIVAIDTLENTGGNVCIAGSTDNTNIYQSDISGLQNHGSAIPCTTEQILNPDHNNSVGFTVAEVTP